MGFVYGRALWAVDGEPLPPARTRARGWSVWSGQRWLEHRFRQAENPIISPEIIVRTSLQKVGGYDPQLPRAADMEMYLRLAAHGDVGFIRGRRPAYYRVVKVPIPSRPVRKSTNAVALAAGENSWTRSSPRRAYLSRTSG